MNLKQLLFLLPLFALTLHAQPTQHVDSLAFINYNGSFDIIHFDNYLVTTQGQVYDVSNPAVPNLLGSFSPPSGVVTAYHYERPYLFVGTGMNAHFQIVDMSFPFAPNAISSTNFGQGDIFGITVSGDYAYLAAGNAGLVSVDISSLTSPIPVDTLAFPNQVRDVGTSGCQVFVSGAGGLHSVDISDPANLSLTSSYGTGYVDLKNYGDTVFVSGSTGALQAISFSNPSNPLPLAGASTGESMWGIDFRDGMIYASSNNGDMYAYELTYPSLTPFAYFNGNAGQGFDVVCSDSLIFLSSLVQGIHILRLDTISPVNVPFPTIEKPCSPAVAVDPELSQPSQWYPNPVAEHARMVLSPEYEVWSECELRVWSVAGKCVGEWNLGTERLLEVNAGEWPAGMYVWELRVDGEMRERGKFLRR